MERERATRETICLRKLAAFYDVSIKLASRNLWASCRLDVEDVFDAVGSNSTFRSNFDVWVCWRAGEGRPDWSGRAAASKLDEDIAFEIVVSFALLALVHCLAPYVAEQVCFFVRFAFN